MTRPPRREVAEEYLLASQVARILQVSPKTVARWARAGKLPYARTLGGHRRFPETEILALVEQLRNEVTDTES